MRTIHLSITLPLLLSLGSQAATVGGIELPQTRGDLRLHTPGEGLTYSFDDTPVLAIDCDEFSNAYFTVWLAEKPSSQTIKKSMPSHD